jgi:translation initiation factor 2D
MALASDDIKEDGKKGKAVFVLHTWKDCLWELGTGGDVPEAIEIPGVDEKEGKDSEDGDSQEVDGARPSNAPETITPAADETPPETSNGSVLSPQGQRSTFPCSRRA